MLEIYITVTPMVMDYTKYKARFYEEGQKSVIGEIESQVSMLDLQQKVKAILVHELKRSDYRTIGDFAELDLTEDDRKSWETPWDKIRPWDGA